MRKSVVPVAAQENVPAATGAAISAGKGTSVEVGDVNVQFPDNMVSHDHQKTHRLWIS